MTKRAAVEKKPTRHFCAQRGCSFETPDEKAPADCPTCGNPFVPHPDPTTIGVDVETGAPLAEPVDPAR